MTKALNTKKYSAIILSAGKSSRMGVPKFSLMFDDKSTFIEKIVNAYADFGCEEIIAVLNNEGVEHFTRLKIHLPSVARIVVNLHPEWERSYSLKTGAKALNNLNPVFISNIDNPFVNPVVLESLALHIDNYDYVFPVFNGKGGHPFMISERFVHDLITNPDDKLHLKVFLDRFSKRAVEVMDEKVLVNVNNQEDYNNIF
jgi:molybdenum cofactor cytidylyltransferase